MLVCSRPALIKSLVDGGGIRGYWSLLILERLMEYIAIEERRTVIVNEQGQDTYVLSSFYPERYPDHVSQLPLPPQRQEEGHLSSTDDERLRAIPQERRYLPDRLPLFKARVASALLARPSGLNLLICP